MNKDRFQAIRDFHERLDEATDNDGLVRELSTEIQKFGFQALVYGMIPIVDNPKIEYLNIDTLAADWMEHYKQHELFAVDYALHHCVRRPSPLRWSFLANGVETKTIATPYHRSYRAAKEFRVSKGVTIPIASEPQKRVGISFVAAHEDSHAAVDQLLDHELDYLRICAELFHVRVDPSQSAIQNYNLSQKNLDCIRFLADGLTNKEIAFRMKAGERAMRDQQERLCKKFGVNTRIQLVAKAQMWGIL